MFRKQTHPNHPTRHEDTRSLEQRVVDNLSFSDTSGKYWQTQTYRDPAVIIRFGEEVEHRQRGKTLVIPVGGDAIVFEVLNHSPFSGFQYCVKDVYGPSPKVTAQEAFLSEPGSSVVDIPVEPYGFIKEITQNKNGLTEPAIDQAYAIELGGLSKEQYAEMRLVNNALHAIHGEALRSAIA